MYTNIITISPHNLDMFRGVPVPSKALKRVFITSIETLIPQHYSLTLFISA